MIHCLFEQSGTFKNEFKKLGYEAQDYDIRNDFQETDNVVDLFDEIELAYEDKPSIFDNMTTDDLLIAFFPCTRFCDPSILLFRGDNASIRKYSDEKKVAYSMELHEELHTMYTKICKLFLICYKKHLKLIIENPWSNQHYLVRYFPVKSSIVDVNRLTRGDNFRNPTQFWFVNCIPQHNVCNDVVKVAEQKFATKIHSTVERSMISPAYANRFIREFILGII